MFRRFRRDKADEQPAPEQEPYGQPGDGDDSQQAGDYQQEGDYAEPAEHGYAAEPAPADYAEPEPHEPEPVAYEPEPEPVAWEPEAEPGPYAEEPAAYAGEPGEGAWEPEPEEAQRTSSGRHRRERHDLGDPSTWTRLRDGQQDGREEVVTTTGPWDSAGDYPELARVDFGSLLVPVREGYEIQAMVSEQEGVSVAVVRGESAIQLQPFAAPRNSGLWGEVRPEIVQEVGKAGGQSAEREGPFGPEVVARVVPQGAGSSVPPQPLRFIGVDGPRWFLRGLISGPAAMDDKETQEFRDILADVVVVRGEHALPPRQPLEVDLPEEARQAPEVPPEEPGGPFNPFERGPEITETR